MLVLSRQPGEKILIGENIEITVVSISGGKVKIGIEAPRSVNIKRKELDDEVRAANVDASKLGPADLPADLPKSGPNAPVIDVPPPGAIDAGPSDAPPKPPRAEGPGKHPKDRPDSKGRDRPA